jgi:hypothetical protein
MPWDFNTNKPYGVFKKILLSPEELKKEAELLKPKLKDLFKKFRESSLPEHKIAWDFFSIYYTNRNAKKLYNTKAQKIDYNQDLINFLKSVRFYRVPDSIRITFINWMENRWKIVLLDYNPTAYEMLNYQANGIRIVTIDWEAAIEGIFVFGIRDAFEHFLHDLEHSYNFFADSVEYEKQTKFFEYLKNFYPEIEDLLKINPDFVQKWEYLVSDMNTHHQHLKHYTKAFLYELIKEINKLNYKNNYYNKIINLFNKIESF